jgi:MSHA biogenesis protein MshP
MHPARVQRGFLIIAGVFLLVVLAGLVAYLTSVSTTSQAASAADINSARAYQAARAGAEWAAFQILEAGGSCAASTDKTFTGTTLSAFTARVTCTSVSGVTEGAATLTAYTIVSTACNEPACPNTTTQSATYAERQITLSIVR